MSLKFLKHRYTWIRLKTRLLSKMLVWYRFLVWFYPVWIKALTTTRPPLWSIMDGMIHVNHPQMDARYVYRVEEYQNLIIFFMSTSMYLINGWQKYSRKYILTMLNVEYTFCCILTLHKHAIRLILLSKTSESEDMAMPCSSQSSLWQFLPSANGGG